MSHLYLEAQEDDFLERCDELLNFQDELRSVFKIPDFKTVEEEDNFNKLLIKKKYQILKRDLTKECLIKL